ncbi:MAG: ABC transporter permease [Eubacteriaceae bacterium]|uniref:ABC transporter permease n=1 Tax=Candidatus Pseudoramibacter fermentans TaxID=2594427 RepID=A0A6L5GP83_9FIRM|nr:ABC transporter permease [Candidatus Pseudoramibacter fermentans]RRF91771.1 MAG: ABC transporter permease [Eubacteriaceae bacterium]
MKPMLILTKRNSKLYFKDKGMFFSSLITPMILLVLYATFLAKVYRESFTAGLPAGLSISDNIIDGLVGGQLISSLLAVSCVTVAFCANMVMVQDKVTGAARDLTIAPVKRSVLSLSYYLSALGTTLLVCLSAMGVGLIYLTSVGWYLTAADVLHIVGDVVLLVLFGTALSSLINFFLTTQGQISAVGTIISSAYGFICGAYMPIASFSKGLRRVLTWLPGTYGTVLLRRHTMRGAFAALKDTGAPAPYVKALRDSVDYNLYFYGKAVSPGTMIAVLGGAAVVLIGLYVLINVLDRRR